MNSLEYKIGTTFLYVGVLLDRTTKLPIDITGWTLQCAISKEFNGKPSSVILQLTGTILSGVDGSFQVTTLQPFPTSAIGTALLDFIFTLPTGQVISNLGYVPYTIIYPATRS